MKSNKILVEVSEMNKYKFYIKDNKEYFEIWKDNELFEQKESYVTYALCDFITNHENDFTDIFFWVKQNYDYISSLVEHKGDLQYEPHPCPHSLMSFGNAFWFYHDAIDCLFEDNSLEDFSGNSWITYGYDEIAKSGTIREIESLFSLARKYIYNFIEEKEDNIDTAVINRTLDIGIENIDGVLCKVLYPKNIGDILYFLMYYLIGQDISYKVCKRCEKPFPCFINKHTKFCDRYDSVLKQTCREMGLNYTEHDSYIDKNTAKTRDSLLKIFDSAYSKQRRKLKAKLIDKNDFKIWSAKARKMRDRCINFEISFDDFVQWLEENEDNYQEEN